ncbi:DUF4442 domain-containing protein [Flavobacterium sp. NKUCC04_CG]|uniref:DUF4442 domain-containing protein n=1 Tax=Flavobacterium sp. NKUCC04_CG TaxID=2842121 RepID=UPI001C5BF52A|nr:DUF4442 domain-containing protein [Flavobacterium sp. NKUCC04_CG]MBW3519403.1 DUF4442 domain-containing protein [Flavobacterium sp. NKUCC04_CG]
MKLTPSKLNSYLFMKLPAAYWTGVRVKEISSVKCISTVKYRWVNQNPFRSMYFAVQAMAAELSTGALVMDHIQASKANISMLVAQNNSRFTKKAVGRIYFECADGEKVQLAIKEAIATGEGQTFWMQSIGRNQNNEVVSEMNFEWTIKVKPPKK